MTTSLQTMRSNPLFLEACRLVAVFLDPVFQHQGLIINPTSVFVHLNLIPGGGDTLKLYLKLDIKKVF